MYGVLPDKLKELEPYITIAVNKTVKAELVVAKRTDVIVELNSADTSLLMQVKGIGEVVREGHCAISSVYRWFCVC